MEACVVYRHTYWANCPVQRKGYFDPSIIWYMAGIYGANAINYKEINPFAR